MNIFRPRFARDTFRRSFLIYTAVPRILRTFFTPASRPARRAGGEGGAAILRVPFRGHNDIFLTGCAGFDGSAYFSFAF